MSENQARLTEILNNVTSRFAPKRGVTAEYIAMVLDVNSVTAPASQKDGVRYPDLPKCNCLPNDYEYDPPRDCPRHGRDHDDLWAKNHRTNRGAFPSIDQQLSTMSKAARGEVIRGLAYWLASAQPPYVPAELVDMANRGMPFRLT